MQQSAKFDAFCSTAESTCTRTCGQAKQARRQAASERAAVGRAARSVIAEQREKCALCMSSVTERTERVGQCAHKLHYVCLMRMLHTANECPNCGSTFVNAEEDDDE
ncbi:hypothetical protein niasHS_006222 [Heterodera schachtii]|uniref:RING-type domain-containing protein n=1 Tax=Heterodera schachtii TaxID=97005 RepID=A0ABD2JSH2_HETSC